jgi:hypothetical protein
VPNIQLINYSLNIFIEENKDKLIDIFNIVKDPNTCCVHIRNGDLPTETDFINNIIQFSYKFEKIILLSGIHSDTYFRDENGKINNFINTINSILNKRDNIFIYLDSPDVHLSVMMNASNLLIHKGGFSCLGSIVSTGNLYITKYFETFANHNIWKSLVNKNYTLVELNN